MKATAFRRHVALVGEFPPPYGGASVFALRLSANLVERGYEVSLISRQKADGQTGIEWIPLLPLRTLGRRLRDRRVEVVHDTSLHAYWGSANIPALLLRTRALQSLPWLVTCGDGSLPDRYRAAPGWQRAYLKRIFRWPDVVAVKGEPLLRWSRVAFPDQKTEMIRSLLPIREGTPPLPSEIQAHIETFSPLVVVTAWAFQPEYELDIVIRALELISATRGFGIILAGSGAYRQENLSAVRRALERAGLSAKTRIVMDVDWVVSALATARVLVRANRIEGDSNSIAEALLLGCVPVVADNGDRPAGCRVFTPGDASSLAAVLRCVLGEPRPAASASAAVGAERNLQAIQFLYEQAIRIHSSPKKTKGRSTRW